MTNAELREFLISREACLAAMNWLGKRDSDQMWSECERPDWLLWWAGQVVSRQELVLAACDCAETALHRVPEGEDRPRLAIDAARRWARGEVTVKEVDAARAAAISSYINAGYAASYAALTAYATPAPFAALAAAAAAEEAARAAARDAADAAAYAAYAADAADAAARAAYAAARAARAARAADRAAYAANATMCQIIRDRWPNCPLPEEA
jgi:hypothetical protein